MKVDAELQPERRPVAASKKARRANRFKRLISPEDPHRRKYKIMLSVHFLLATVVNFALDLAFQVI